jgi:hypothetical protein
MHPYGKKLCPSPLQRFLYFYESESIQKLIKDKKKIERINHLISLPGILVSLKTSLRKLTLFRYVTGRCVRSSVIEKSLLMESG